MKPTAEVSELMERIRQAANQETGAASDPTPGQLSPDWPVVAESFPPPTSPQRTNPGGDEAARPDTLLEQAASMLRGGRTKTAVGPRVPRWLRPFFRNQGGYNSVLLEAAERLVEVNRILRQQNYDLHEKMMDLHAWAFSVAGISAENHAWMLAADARLQALSVARPEPSDREESDSSPNTRLLDERLARLTAHVEAMETERRALNDHLHRLRAQLDQQAEHTRAVHHHLDQLGAHVDATLHRLERSA